MRVNLTQRTVLTNSQATELAMLASIWTAPSINHKTYEVAKSVVQTALKQNKINLMLFLSDQDFYT